jgi:hypothetical protein
VTREEYDLEMEEIAAQNWSIARTAIAQTILGARYIASLEAEIKQLREDNQQLIEQVNRFAELSVDDFAMWKEAWNKTIKKGETK